MATDRKSYCRVANVVGTAGWSDSELATMVRLQSVMAKEWADQGLTAEQANTITLSTQMCTVIASRATYDRSVRVLLALRSRIAIEVIVTRGRHAGVTIKWPNFAEFQGLVAREQGKLRVRNARGMPESASTPSPTPSPASSPGEGGGQAPSPTAPDQLHLNGTPVPPKINGSSVFDPRKLQGVRPGQFPEDFPVWPLSWFRDRWEVIETFQRSGGVLHGWEGVLADDGEAWGCAGYLVAIAWLSNQWPKIVETVESRAVAKKQPVNVKAYKSTASTWWRRMCSEIQRAPDERHLQRRDFEDSVMAVMQLFEMPVITRESRKHTVTIQGGN